MKQEIIDRAQAMGLLSPEMQEFYGTSKDGTFLHGQVHEGIPADDKDRYETIDHCLSYLFGSDQAEISKTDLYTEQENEVLVALRDIRPMHQPIVGRVTREGHPIIKLDDVVPDDIDLPEDGKTTYQTE